MREKKGIAVTLATNGKNLAEVLDELADEAIDELCQGMGINRFEAIELLYSLNNELICRLKKNRALH